jgi:hypothetical protein
MKPDGGELGSEPGVERGGERKADADADAGSGRGASVLGAFLWSLVGLGYGMGVLTALTIGPYLVIATILVAVVLLVLKFLGPSMAGLISGPGWALLYLAYLNRRGPGMVCAATSGGESCADQWDPWPFGIVGMLVFAAGIATFLWARRRSHASRAQSPHS